ncbi:putative zn 2cys6 transcription factor protein [Phaeoacremonium minimum UCRPA7]|uniref:Putative zn 2cys6 transcription factor protein n=1 Tax=Phaeoacremonium minimum (strain UCR-PA7) TaxID=1286976 RepID=R8BD75_PHAM7|nr:putative zn 2cys6 transcription factor protein [Phaeoacremonium minimum UCRPA7]EON97242.1 putative zn 2cys6 transcription factor protein [Phaeoacremonium minimum UCRPA7]
MIDAYFRMFHLSYPIVHEPTFRAQYSQVISRPHGDSWLVLAYVVAAIGVFTSAISMDDNLDLGLFAQARSILSFNFLEIGNLTLVQALTLIANYLQKRDRPNSGYNTLGIAVRMAMGLGLHKEFQGWNISPLSMEIRRRVWWSLCVFDSGATITFGRPLVWPFEGIEVSLPMNVDDRELTPISKSYPPESKGVTPYTAVAAQAKFHLATNAIYARVISKPLPSAEEILRLDEELLDSWLEGIPAFFRENAPVPERYAFAKDALQWRYRNIRIIMYRPFVIRKALHARDGRRDDASPETMRAYERCLEDAKITISSIRGYWAVHEHNRFGAWYALYYIFQAALIPCICLRNDPASPQASDWREQIATTLQTIASLASVTPSAGRCHQVISELCGRYLDAAAATPMSAAYLQTDGSQDDGPLIESKDTISLGGNSPYVPDAGQVSFDDLGPIDESPQTQINSVFTMMWPNVPPMEAADLVMGEDAWMDFLMGEGAGDDSNVNLDNDGLGMM